MTTQTERTCGRFVLVGCGDAKADNPVEARNLYTSSYFAAKRSLAEAAVQWARTADRRANSWSILSVEHAILMPRQTVAPYDTILEDLRGEPIEGEPPYRLPSGDRAETQLDRWALRVHSPLGDWLQRPYAADQQESPCRELVVLAGSDYRTRGDMDHFEGQWSIDPFSKAFGQLEERIAATDADVLSAVYEAYGMSSDAFSQHFTPHSVYETMAEIAGVIDKNDTDDRQTVLDPACGSGRMLLVAGRKQPDALLLGQDRDPLCARMTALNCCFLNLDAYVIQGDSLTVEFQGAWQTSYSASGSSVRELDDEEVSELREWVTAAFENTVEDGNQPSPEQQRDAGSEDRTAPVTASVPSEQASLGTFESSD